MADGGYDVADYRAIEPAFGTLAEAEAFIRDALDLGIRTIVDIVPNHVSDQHEWFEEALAAGPGSPVRERFWFRPGRGTDGSLPPNGWSSHFGDIAWTRTRDLDGTPGEWYLHLFSPGQPDLNWQHPDVRREHEDVLRFWFDRGVAGVRIDSAALAMKHPDLPELDPQLGPGEHPFQDRDDLHDLYRVVAHDRRRLPSSARPHRGALAAPTASASAATSTPTNCTRRSTSTSSPAHGNRRPCVAASSRPSTPICPSARRRRGCCRTTTSHASSLGTAAPTRRSRSGRSGSVFRRTARWAIDGRGRPRYWRWRCPAADYLYQGEELGLPEVEDLPVDRIQDPMHFQSGGVDPGRDGCRVPLPWSGTVRAVRFQPARTRSPSRGCRSPLIGRP